MMIMAAEKPKHGSPINQNSGSGRESRFLKCSGRA